MPTLPLFSQTNCWRADPAFRDLILQRAARVVRSRMQASKRQAHQLVRRSLRIRRGAPARAWGAALRRIRATHLVDDR